MVSTPDRDRIITFTINGGTFRYRRPSRSDTAEVTRRFVSKLGKAKDIKESDILSIYDGTQLLWECRFEVGFSPRVISGKEISLGEKAPDHWYLDGEVSFHDVEDSEFDDVCAYLGTAIYMMDEDQELANIEKQLDLLTKRKEALESKKKK